MLRTAGLVSRKRRERDFADELDSHLQMHVDDNIRSGMAPDQARREALLRLGGVEPTKESWRDRNTIPALENLKRDFQYALRQLRKNPGFTSAAIAVLALGMCAGISIFAFVDAALLKPLPYRDPARLIGVFESVALIPRSNLSYPDYLDWKRLNNVFSSLDAYQHTGFILTTSSGAQPARGARVTAGFFRTLGVTPVLGRDFHEGEDLPSAANTVLLSYAGWQKQYGGRADVLGRSVLLNGIPHTIIGVLPRSFHFAPAEPAAFWTAFHATSECDLRRSCHALYGIGRLKNGVSIDAALAEMKSIARQLEKEYPDSNRGQGADIVPLSEVLVGDIRPILFVLFGGAGLLLLIAGVNVANLLVVRSENRRREMAVRNSLGATRGRLISQFAAEAVVLTVLGAALGLASAGWTMRLLTRLIPEEMLAGMPFLLGLGINQHILMFAGTITLLAATLFLIPGLHYSSPRMREGLAESSRRSSGNLWRRVGAKLVVLELGLATVLLAGAGLLSQSLYHLLHVELGFQPDRLATLFVAIPPARYANDNRIVALARQLIAKIDSLPAVESGAIASRLPVSGNGDTDWIRFAGRPYHGEHNEVNERDVSAAYFKTIGAKLLRGRYFTDDEDASKPNVAIINQALARKYFPGEDPLGRRFGDIALSPKSMKQIVGVVDDIREGSLDSEVWPAEYRPFNQSTDHYFGVVVRVSHGARAILPEFAAAIHKLDPGIVIDNPMAMNDRISNSPSAYLHRSAAWLVGGFASVALLLSAIGVYGVLAYSVSRRTREIGVRIALGAEPRSIHRLILKEAGRLAITGVALGILSSVLLTAAMRSLLFGVRSWDLPTLAAVGALLACAALLASYLPARRAAAVNPVDALRAD